jgi:hypothetical protein
MLKMLAIDEHKKANATNHIFRANALNLISIHRHFLD